MSVLRTLHFCLRPLLYIKHFHSLLSKASTPSLSRPHLGSFASVIFQYVTLCPPDVVTELVSLKIFTSTFICVNISEFCVMSSSLSCHSCTPFLSSVFVCFLHRPFLGRGVACSLVVLESSVVEMNQAKFMESLVRLRARKCVF